MTKLLKKITLVSTTAFLLCITTTTTNFPTISMETEHTQISEDNEQDNHTNTKNEYEIQPLHDKDTDKAESEYPLL